MIHRNPNSTYYNQRKQKLNQIRKFNHSPSIKSNKKSQRLILSQKPKRKRLRSLFNKTCHNIKFNKKRQSQMLNRKRLKSRFKLTPNSIKLNK